MLEAVLLSKENYDVSRTMSDKQTNSVVKVHRTPPPNQKPWLRHSLRRDLILSPDYLRTDSIRALCRAGAWLARYSLGD